MVNNITATKMNGLTAHRHFSQAHGLLFYLGTLLSSIGSMTFTVSLVAFLLKHNNSFLVVGVAVGSPRLVPLLINILFGDLGDRVPPRSLVIVTEIIGAALSAVLLLLWQNGETTIWSFIAVHTLRASIIALQVGSRAKIAKLLSEETFASNTRHATFLNYATQGSTFFAGIIAWYAIQSWSFSSVILFDAATFLSSGILLLFLNLPSAPPAPGGPAAGGVFEKFRNLYRYSGRAAGLDLMLAVVLSGAHTFGGRLVGQSYEWLSILLIGYGLAVWLGGQLNRLPVLREMSWVLWPLLGASFLAVGMVPGQGWVTCALAFCKDTFYWTLLHRISSHIQADTPKEITASVYSARTIQMVMTLAVGEFAVGLWQPSLSVAFDGAWRAAVCLAAMAMSLGSLRLDAKTP